MAAELKDEAGRVTGYTGLEKISQTLAPMLQNMCMSCNSTYLLDQEADHGVKADALAALLDGLHAQPGAKAVVFSQWTRTNDVVMLRLGCAGWAMSASMVHRMGQKRPGQVVNFIAKAMGGKSFGTAITAHCERFPPSSAARRGPKRSCLR